MDIRKDPLTLRYLQMEIATPEVAVLACALRSARAAEYVTDNVQYSDFVSGVAQRLYMVMRNAVNKGKVLDATTVQVLLSQEHLSDSAMAAFKEKVQAVILPPEKGTKQYCEELRLWARDTKVRLSIEEAYNEVTEGEPPEKAKARLLNRLTQIELGLKDNQAFDHHPTLHVALWEELFSEQPKGLLWGHPKLDRWVQPLLSGNLALLGGPSGSGKSTIARNLILQWIATGVRVAAMTSEMPYNEQVYNYSSMILGIPIERIMQGNLSKDEKHAIARVSGSFDRTLTINQRSDISPDYVLSSLRRYAQDGHGILVLDHLHRVNFPGRADDKRHHIGDLAQGIKSLAADQHVIILVLVQLRKPERGFYEPSDEDIRESGKIVEEADKVLFVYRKEVWGRRDGGVFTPHEGAGNNRRVFTTEPDPFQKTGRPSDRGTDEQHVYIKIGKQRVRPRDGTLQLPFDASTGLILGGVADVRERTFTTQLRELSNALARTVPEAAGLPSQIDLPTDEEALSPPPPPAVGDGLRHVDPLYGVQQER